jgi:membrane protease YdiL (CAAX protease family)
LLSLRHGRWRFWWALAGFILLNVLALAAMFVILMGFDQLAAVLGGADLLAYARSGDTGLILENPYSLYGFVLLGISLPPAVWACTRMHGQPGFSYFVLYGDFRWSRFWRAGLAALITGVPGFILALVFYGDDLVFRFDVLGYPLLLAATVGVVAIQTFGEELVFRGYLYHAWARIFPRPVLVATVLSAVFASLHIGNADVVRDPVPALVGLFVFALFTQWLTVRTGSLDAAWGLHFMNNIIASLVVSAKPGPETNATLVEYTDRVLTAGGSYALDPVGYLLMAGGFWLFWWSVTDRRSPFYLEPRGG